MIDPRAKRPPPAVVPCIQPSGRRCPLYAQISWVRAVREPLNGSIRPSVLLKARSGGAARWYECLIDLETLRDRLAYWGVDV